MLTQQQVLNEELSSLEGAFADADDATKKLKVLYADGIVRAPVSAYVGARLRPLAKYSDQENR